MIRIAPKTSILLHSGDAITSYANAWKLLSSSTSSSLTHCFSILNFQWKWYINVKALLSFDFHLLQNCRQASGMMLQGFLIFKPNAVIYKI